MDGSWIVDDRLDVASRQLGDDGIAIACIDYKLMVDTFVPRVIHRYLYANTREKTAVLTRNLLPLCGPCVQPAQLDPQNGSLEPLHSVVVAYELVFVASSLSMGPG